MKCTVCNLTDILGGFIQSSSTCTFWILLYLPQLRLDICLAQLTSQDNLNYPMIGKNFFLWKFYAWETNCIKIVMNEWYCKIPSIVVLQEIKQSKFSFTNCFFSWVLPLRSAFNVRAPASKSAALVSWWTRDKKILGSKFGEEYVTLSAKRKN